jgi:hypothetical protein
MIHFHKPIRLQIGRSMREQPDIHARLMSHYPQGTSVFFPALAFRRCYCRPRKLNNDIRQFLTGTIFAFLVRSEPLSSSNEGGISLTKGYTVVTFIFACVCIELWPSGMTIWALVIALVVGKCRLQYVYNYRCFEADERLLPFSSCLRYTHWNDPGDYESTNWTEVRYEFG